MYCFRFPESRSSGAGFVTLNSGCRTSRAPLLTAGSTQLLIDVILRVLHSGALAVSLSLRGRFRALTFSEVSGSLLRLFRGAGASLPVPF